ncbi:hypothetical protein [Haloferula sp. BvORR071]|uniref:hypothetical protein n=1 Tax=Haloferula sp. BvORR071 TaxID=1396141 RepID=UPI0005527E88|nr:hypothetical protein [Haloferula sp. BvORR071]
MKSPAAIALILASCGLASAAQNPSDAALAWLRDVAAGKAEVKPGEGTALSPETSPEDLKGIRSRLVRLRKSLRPEDLRPVADKEDGDLAAVLVSQITNFDSNTVQIHAVGLVKEGDNWLPAPLPSSFDNTGLSFRPGFLQRATNLEDWMLQERSDQLLRLKNDAFSLLAEEMRKVISPGALQQATPTKLAENFLAALTKRDLPAALAMLGGLEEPRPADWDETFQVVSGNLRKKEITHSLWRLLASPEAVRAIVATEDDDKEPLVSIVALDPDGDASSRLRPRTVHLPFVRSAAGNWHIRLTHDLLAPATRPLSPGQEADDEVLDAEFIEKFPGKLKETLAPTAVGSAREAAQAMVNALRQPSLADACHLLDLGAPTKGALDSMSRAAELWRKIHNRPDGVSPLLLDAFESGDDAVALVQMFAGRDPVKPAIEKLYFRRGEKGWLANPVFGGEPEFASATSKDAIAAWQEQAMDARRREWWTGTVGRIGGIAADSAPSEEDTRRLVDEARKALVQGDAEAVFTRSACFDDDTGINRLLRNIGSDIRDGQAGEILGIHRSGRWAAVSLRVPPPDGDDSANLYPLVLVVSTPAGPRLLPELDLYDPLTRTRDFLNRGVWDRVTARLPEGARGELEAIFEKHRALSAADRGRQKTTE